MQARSVIGTLCLVWVGFVLASFGVRAQEINIPARITHAIDETKLTVLKGNTHPQARAEFDNGPAPPSLAMNRMLLVLGRTAAQESSVKSLLDQQQQKSSANYHRWLAPEQFGQQFGAADQDVHTITSWLSLHGFRIGNIAKNRLTIEFSGTAGQVKEAFHTEIHQYEIDGKQYWANSSDPAIPSALAPVVAGITSLHDFGRRPMYREIGIAPQEHSGQGLKRIFGTPWAAGPLFTGNPVCGITGVGLCYGVAPYDFATIYNVLPLWNANPAIDGTGQTVAIVSQSDIDPQDVSDFRSDFGLPAPNLNIINNGPDPEILYTSGDELESDIDVELAGAVAKGATIDLVISASTNTTAGVDLSALYIVDNDLAPVMSESYGACEFEMGTAGNQFYNQLWQQAAAEGITVFVSAGDSGSAGCDQNQPIATQGLAVNGIASTPYNIAVGGTDFDDPQNSGTYWSTTNNAGTEQSALSYIPEMSWNDTCTNSEYFSFNGESSAEADCNDTSSKYWGIFTSPVGGSGGISSCTTPSGQSVSGCAGGYAKPSWQTGTGVPNDGKRDVPDVSLFSADGLNASFYVVCQNGSCADGDYRGVVLIGGTSAAAPEFAGIMALVNQKTQSRQGLANYTLYPLAAQPGASCDSTGTLNASCIFYDVTVGTNATPCTTGTPNCQTNTSGDQNGVLTGYSTTTGYDLATGLGSVNVANLVNNWSSITFQPTTATLSLSPNTQITHGSAVNVNINVTPDSGTGTPTGFVSLITSAGPAAGTFTLSTGSVTSTTTTLPGGSYNVTAHYAGDGSYAASDSSPGVAVTVNPEPSVTTMEVFTLDQNGNMVPYTGGTYGASVIYLRTSVAGQSGQGLPTGSVNLTQTLNGVTTNLPGNPYQLNSESYTMTPLPGYYYRAFTPGTYSFTAKYSGDASFNASNSSPIGFTITQAPTNITLECLPGNGGCSIGPNTFIEILALLSYGSSPIISNQPSGTVTFFSNGNSLGSFPVEGGFPSEAVYSTAQFVGVNNVTAQYNGDSNYTGSTSAPIVIQVGGGSFSISANPSVITIGSPGQSGSTTLTFTTQQGFTGSTTLQPYMCENLPPQSTCSFSPTALAFTPSTSSATVTFTISTAAASSSWWAIRLDPKGRFRSGDIIMLWTWFVCIALLVSLRKSRRQPIAAFAILVFIACGLACGGGGTNGGSGGGGSGVGGTPVGNYRNITVNVTINSVTGSVSNLSVDVQ